MTDLSSYSSSTLKRVLWYNSLLLGLATTALGLVVIVGWHVGNSTLIQDLPQFVPMQYNTALGFVSKPVKRETLFAEIERVLKSS